LRGEVSTVFLNMQTLKKILLEVKNGRRISKPEAMLLYTEANLSDVMHLADCVRKRMHPDNKVGWIIDRNINIGNKCISGCLFCNYYSSSRRAKITSFDEYAEKISELIKKGGKQVLLQGGCNPDMDIVFYENLFRSLKNRFPEVKLHALGPPEVFHIASISGIGIKETLMRLRASGLDSLPGAGAEILSDRVRKTISPGKCNTREWLEVMKEAHKLNIASSATMMFGHIETDEERIAHLFLLRNLQDKKPENATGFFLFVAWPFQREKTALIKKFPDIPFVSPLDYIKLIAISRIVLDNIPHIQASLLTVGVDTASLCLHAGANDLGSVMLEENVVSAAGNRFMPNQDIILQTIKQAGFIPYRRDEHLGSKNYIDNVT